MYTFRGSDEYAYAGRLDRQLVAFLSSFLENIYKNSRKPDGLALRTTAGVYVV